MLKQVRVPKSLSTIIAADNTLLKPLTVFFQLKSLYVGGSLKQFKSRYPEFSATIGVSQSKLRYSVKWLLNEGFAWYSGSELRLVGSHKVRDKFNIPTNKKDSVPFADNRTQELIIKTVSIGEGLKQQEFVVRQKVAKKLCSGSLKGKSLQTVVEQGLNAFHAQNKDSILNDTMPAINTQITFSRQGIAKRFNRISKSTGTRLIAKLKKLTLVNDAQNLVRVCRMSIEGVYQYKIHMNKPNAVYKNGYLWLQLCNTISVNPF